MVLMTSPLWELVWITGRGLSLQYVGSSMGMAESNEPLFYNTESSNIIISSPQCPNNEQNRRSNSLGAESLTILNPDINHIPENSQKCIIAGSPKSTVSSPINSELPELKSRSHGDAKPDDKTTQGMVCKQTDSHGDINEKEQGSCSPRNAEYSNANMPAIEVVDVAEDKAFLSGEDHPEVTEAAHDRNHSGCLSGSKDHHKSVRPESNSVDCNIAENVKTLPGYSSSEHKHDGLGAGVSADEQRIRTCSNFSIFELLGQRCPSNIRSLGAEKEIEITSASSPSPQIACENEIPQANHTDGCPVVGSQSTDIVNTCDQLKGKEKLQCDSTSDEKKDGNESVESSNSSKRISKGKRALEFDTSTYKRFKMDGGEDSSSGSLVKRNSSFLHLMSVITNNGVSRDGKSIIPSEICEEKENYVGLCAMNEKTVPVERFPMGFTSVFQSLYSSSSIAKNFSDDSIQRQLNDRKELKSCYSLIKGHQNIRDPSDYDSDGLFSGEDHKLKFEDPKCRNYQVIKSSPAKFDVHTSSYAQNNVKRHSGQECSVFKTGNPSSSTNNSIACSKESQPSYVPNSRNDVALSSRRDFCDNLWISRFLRKDSENAVRSLSCHFGIDKANEKRANKSIVLASNKNDNDDSNVGNHFFPHLQRRNFATSKEHAPTGPASSISNKSEAEPSKTPPHQFKDSEARNYLVVRRSNVPRHLMPENNWPPCAAIDCILRGGEVHHEKGSSRIIETSSKDKQFGHDNDMHQPEKLEQFMKSNDGNVAPSCLPTHCFRTNCTKNAYQSTYLNMNITRNSSSSVKDCWISVQDKPGSRNSCSHATKVAFLSNRRGEPRVQNDSDVQINCRTNKITAQVARHLNRSEKCIGESMVLEKQCISGLRRADAREHQLTPLCSLVADEGSDEQNEIFEAIRKLRLSRSEMMRLLKSKDDCKTLEGFFLRLRLGQWEKELGGTGYHVARINGASCEKTLSISIGQLTCIVDSRFVSNHDFFEDELKAWWSTTLTSGKIPSRNELYRKINERLKLGL